MHATLEDISQNSVNNQEQLDALMITEQLVSVLTEIHSPMNAHMWSHTATESVLTQGTTDMPKKLSVIIMVLIPNVLFPKETSLVGITTEEGETVPIASTTNVLEEKPKFMLETLMSFATEEDKERESEDSEDTLFAQALLPFASILTINVQIIAQELDTVLMELANAKSVLAEKLAKEDSNI